MNHPIKHIAVLVESSRAFGRRLIEGVCEFAEQQSDWQLHYREAALDLSLAKWLDQWQGNAIIARVNSIKDAELLASTGLPVVDVLGQVRHPQIPSVDVEHQAIAKMAADFFRRAGFVSFAYCGYDGVHFSDQRREAFVTAVEALDGKLSVYGSQGHGAKISTREAGGHHHAGRIGDWLGSLPKPCGVFACNDVRALDVSIAARMAGLRVPEDIAILGVDDDSLICQMASPANSSIRPDVHRQGYLGAQLLQQLQLGQDVRQKRMSIEPIGITERLSTDYVVTKLDHVSKAFRYIRAHVHQSIGAEQIAQHVGVSRSLLDRDFKNELGRTVGEEIRALRLRYIKVLLSHSELSLEDIAMRSGFANKVSVSAFFKAQTGMTPGRFREQKKRLP